MFSGTRSVVISEVSTGSTDWFEIQNVSGRAVNTTGWFVAINDGNVPQTINAVDPITWTIGPSMAAGQTSYRTENAADTSNYFGSLIDWPTTGSRGWVMIVDNTGKIADFVVWGYSAVELSTINVSVGGFTFNSQAIAAAWSSAPVSYAGTATNSLHRQGSSDDDNSTDWVYTGTPSLGTINPGLVTPMTGPGEPVRTGIGFNTNPQGLNVKYVKANTPVFDVNVAEQVVVTPSMQTSVTNQLVSLVNYNTNGGPGNFGAEVPFPTQAAGQDVDDFVLEVTGTVVLPNAGQWTFGVNSDDGFRLVLTNGVNTFMSEFIGGRPAGDTLATFNIPDGGAYQVRLVYFERGGGASMEFFAAPGAHATFNANFDLIGDVANGGLATTGFGGAIQTNVLAQLRNVNSSLWTRIPFTVGNPSAFSSLALRMKYNDGFIAYLNGSEIARRNAVSTNWNATATSPRSDAASSVFEEINITQFLHLLQAGTNILSIHGQNISAGDNTFLVLPELVGTRTEPEFRYFLDPTPGGGQPRRCRWICGRHRIQPYARILHQPVFADDYDADARRRHPLHRGWFRSNRDDRFRLRRADRHQRHHHSPRRCFQERALSLRISTHKPISSSQTFSPKASRLRRAGLRTGKSTAIKSTTGWIPTS